MRYVTEDGFYNKPAIRAEVARLHNREWVLSGMSSAYCWKRAAKLVLMEAQQQLQGWHMQHHTPRGEEIRKSYAEYIGDLRA